VPQVCRNGPRSREDVDVRNVVESLALDQWGSLRYPDVESRHRGLRARGDSVGSSDDSGMIDLG
jgi:hypothetical protein